MKKYKTIIQLFLVGLGILLRSLGYEPTMTLDFIIFYVTNVL